MSKNLVTFSGKYGDILWSLPTVKKISQLVGEPVDFATMPMYHSLLPLLARQSYINTARAMSDWMLMHSNYGDQPWNPPSHTQCVTQGQGAYECKAGWDKCWHLGYRQHPGKVFGAQEMQLIDFTAWQQGIYFNQDNPLPFIDTPELVQKPVDKYIAVSFNDQYIDLKAVFYNKLVERFGSRIVATTVPWDNERKEWKESSQIIANAAGYVGCRSSNYVIAHGVKKRMITYEPHPARNAQGHLGFVFGCNYGQENCLPLTLSPLQAADIAIPILDNWLNGE